MAQKRKSEQFLIRNYKSCWKFLREVRWCVVFALGLFCFFILIGFTFPLFFQNEIFGFMEEITERFEGLGVSETIFEIFFNNLKASFFAVVLGVVIGIFPLVIGIVNGYLLGFVARYAVQEGGIFVLWRLLPHGVFEIPAVILSIGIGLKIGWDVLRKDRRGLLKKDFKEAMRFFIFVVVPLLAAAGVVEGVLIWMMG